MKSEYFRKFENPFKDDPNEKWNRKDNLNDVPSFKFLFNVTQELNDFQEKLVQNAKNELKKFTDDYQKKCENEIKFKLNKEFETINHQLDIRLIKTDNIINKTMIEIEEFESNIHEKIKDKMDFYDKKLEIIEKKVDDDFNKLESRIEISRGQIKRNIFLKNDMIKSDIKNLTNVVQDLDFELSNTKDELMTKKEKIAKKLEQDFKDYVIKLETEKNRVDKIYNEFNTKITFVCSKINEIFEKKETLLNNFECKIVDMNNKFKEFEYKYDTKLVPTLKENQIKFNEKIKELNKVLENHDLKNINKIDKQVKTLTNFVNTFDNNKILTKIKKLKYFIEDGNFKNSLETQLNSLEYKIKDTEHLQNRITYLEQNFKQLNVDEIINRAKHVERAYLKYENQFEHYLICQEIFEDKFDSLQRKLFKKGILKRINRVRTDKKINDLLKENMSTKRLAKDLVEHLAESKYLISFD